jgi:polyphosphate kinase
VIPQLKQNNIHLLYGEDIPSHIQKDISAFFFTQVLSFIQPVKLSKHTDFFSENNKLYMAVIIQTDQADEIHVLNIPF